jgi:hypothetical protein
MYYLMLSLSRHIDSNKENLTILIVSSHDNHIPNGIVKQQSNRKVLHTVLHLQQNVCTQYIFCYKVDSSLVGKNTF